MPGGPGGGSAALVRARIVVRIAREGMERSMFWCGDLVDGPSREREFGMKL